MVRSYNRTLIFSRTMYLLTYIHTNSKIIYAILLKTPFMWLCGVAGRNPFILRTERDTERRETSCCRNASVGKSKFGLVVCVPFNQSHIKSYRLRNAAMPFLLIFVANPSTLAKLDVCFLNKVRLTTLRC